MTWQILEGKSEIPITLFEAEESVDSGPICLTGVMQFKPSELFAELRRKQGEATIRICKKFIDEYPEFLSKAKVQSGEESVFPRRTPKDSRLNVNKTIAERFNLLRVVDNERYPAFFEHVGSMYIIKIEKTKKR